MSSSKNKLRTTRLNKEEFSLEKEPIENAFVKRKDELKFYFCLYKLEDDFTNGFYFGLLQLHPDYPFYAPKLFFYTPNGRYEQNIPICTSFTNYHQESWTSAWNVRTLIQATISFMYANEPSYGCRSDPAQMRKKYARDSLSWNMQNDLFQQLFAQIIKSKLHDLVKLGIHIYEQVMIKELKRLGLEQMNNNNYRPISQNPSANIYNHSISNRQDLREQLNVPLINNHEIEQIQRELDNIREVNDQRDIGGQRDEEAKRKKQKEKKIMKIIGFFVVASAFGVFVYYSWWKPSSDVSGSSSSTNTPQKSVGALQWLYQIPKNLIGAIQSFTKNPHQKITVQN